MARISSSKAAGGKKKHSDLDLPSDDEVDAFHKSKDKLALNVSDDDASSDSGSDDEGMGDDGDLLGLSDDESDDESESDDDEDGDGRLAQRELISFDSFPC